MITDEQLKLFTPVSEGLPKTADNNYLCVLNNEFVRYCYFGLQKRFSDNHFCPLIVTHWLDLSILTTRENAVNEYNKGFFEGHKIGLKEQVKYTCKYSGESFDLGDECWYITTSRLDLSPLNGVIEPRDKKIENNPILAFFHNEQDAINWSENKFKHEL